jgi:hypothetical protein
VSLYAGLTRILDADFRIVSGPEPAYRFFIEHEIHRQACTNYDGWSAWQSLEGLAARWPEVRAYLDERVRWFDTEPSAAHHVIEGRVHAAMCSDAVASYRVINREASPAFRDEATKTRICARIREEIRRILNRVRERKAWLRYRDFGTSCDILAVDDNDCLLVVEAKPSTYKAGIVKGPIQARFYAGLISRWLETQEPGEAEPHQQGPIPAHLPEHDPPELEYDHTAAADDGRSVRPAPLTPRRHPARRTE